MTDHLSIGVIGHVDHGKTTLVKALTGTDTDRLEEEKRRGLTIVLGFAHRQTPRGMIDFIDAPGHADFVRIMISGATGIDAALIVVAANEGIMPQTVEHIRIASLLGIKRAVVALSKADLANDAEIAQTKVAVADFLLKAGFDAPTIVPASAQNGTGMGDLAAALENLFHDTEPRTRGSGFYLPFDRVFTVQGFGTVATGTLRAGIMRVDDEGEISPLGARARVRGMEVHGASVDLAKPGQRVAVNIRTDADLERGQALASPGLMVPSHYWDAELQLVADLERPLKNGTPVRVLHGTTETQASIRLLDRDRMQAGDTANVQFRMKVPAAAWGQDRFILRTVSPVATIGGGRFLNTNANRRKRFDDATMAQLQAVGGDDVAQALMAHIAQAGADGASLEDAADRFSLIRQDAAAMALEGGCVAGADGQYYAAAVIDAEGQAVIQLVKDFHAANPSRMGIGQPELVNLLSAPAALVHVLIEQLAEAGDLCIKDGQISLPEFDPLAALGAAKRSYLDQLEARIRDAATTPPSMGELIEGNRKDQALAELLIEIGRIVPMWDFKRANLFLFHSDAIDEAVRALRAAFPPPTEFRLGEAREVLNSTRKYIVPFLTWLDGQNITRRTDDFRQMTEIKDE